MRSSDEQEIRDAVVSRFRELVPDARIVHELNVAGQGSNRIDVAAIGTQTIIGCEIKSRKDTLKRLPEQWEAFSKCCHYVVVAAHQKHFTERRAAHWPPDWGSDWKLNSPGFDSNYRMEEAVWRFPRPPGPHRPYVGEPWTFNLARDCDTEPAPRALLQMLWADELRMECFKHGLSAGRRSTIYSMTKEMLWSMTGREIVEAVCRQLRQRSFTEADDPIAFRAAA